MTKKRFTTDNGSNEDVCLVDTITGKEYESNFDDIVDLLNALHEENVKLQARNKYLAMKIQRERASAMKQHEKWEEEIQKENQQLKQQNELLEEELLQCKAVIDKQWNEYLQKKELESE